jgi:hypothetical protein
MIDQLSRQVSYALMVDKSDVTSRRVKSRRPIRSYPRSYEKLKAEGTHDKHECNSSNRSRASGQPNRPFLHHPDVPL